MAQPAPPLGWPLLPVPVEGELHYPSLEESVRQSIQVILLTRPGEQLMRPQFGAGLADFLHEANTLVTRRRIRDRVQESLQRWEGRIVVDRVGVWPGADRGDTVKLEIAYRLVPTGAPATVQLSVTLAGTAE